MIPKQQVTVLHPASYDRAIDNLVILVAMKAEATPMIEALHLKPVDIGLTRQLHLQAYRGKVANRTIHLVVNGVDPDYSVDQIGTEAAAVSACTVITQLRPDTIISAGTAGGFAQRGAALGDVVLSSDSFFFHDHDIPVDPRYASYGRGSYPCLDLAAVASYFRLKRGIISTGNSLTITAQEQHRLNQYGAIAKEMEVAAIAKIARQFGVRVTAVKAITNLVGLQEDAACEFKKHFDKATQNLARILPKIIHYILGKTPKQLQAPISVEECVA